MTTNLPLRALLLLVILATAAACQSTYYAGMEKLGVHKRDILADRVELAKDAQTDAKEQFQTALEKFTAVVGFDGGQLAQRYADLNAEFKASESRAEAVRDRIDSVEDVAGALFDEWEAELEQYSSARLKSQSRKQLATTRLEYDRLIRAMRRAEARMDPVLDTFRDQVLFLKHNLNARAVSSLRGELAGVEADVAELIKAMNDSISQAETFVSGLSQ